MTPQKAIAVLNEIPTSETSDSINEAICEATKALELFTAKACETKNNLCYCPNCRLLLGNIKTINGDCKWDMNHCKSCGQHLDWKQTIDNYYLPQL